MKHLSEGVMKITISVIKSEVVSNGGHIAPSSKNVKEISSYIENERNELVIDHYVGSIGDDISIMLTHQHGEDNPDVYKLACDAFSHSQIMQEKCFSQNTDNKRLTIAELEFEERESEPFLLFAADKTNPGAFNLPLYLSFIDPMNTPGLILAHSMAKGFKFVIMDINYTEGDRVIELNSPEDLYDIAVLLREPERYVVESVWTRETSEKAVALSTSRLHKIAGKYNGRDDPVMLIRVQDKFPTTGEIIHPYSIGHFVAGGMHECHQMPLMPVEINAGICYSEGSPIVSCAAFTIKNGILTEAIDVFKTPFWDTVRNDVSHKAMDMRKQGFFGAAMLPISELEYTGVMTKLESLNPYFVIRH